MANLFGSDRNGFKHEEKDGDSAIWVGKQGEEGKGNGFFVYPVFFTGISIRLGDKVQIVESFSDTIHLNAFGRGATILGITGHVMGDSNLNNGQEATGKLLIGNYEKNLRAFELAKKGELTTISTHMGIVYSGVCLGLEFSHNAQMRAISNFSMNFVVVSNIMGVS